MPADSTVILPTVILSAALGSIRTSHKRARRLFRRTRLVILSVVLGSIHTSPSLPTASTAKRAPTTDHRPPTTN